MALITGIIIFLKRELAQLYRFLKTNRNEIAVTCYATLFLTLYKYHPLETQWMSSLVYYAALPLAAIISLKKSPLDYGLKLGRLKVWGFWVVVTCLIGIPVLYLASRGVSFQSYYTLKPFNLLQYSWQNILSLLALEFFLRGFLLFGLRDKLGEASILVQMIPFVLIHFGKPEVETLSTIVTGIYFGYIAYRGKSFWPAFLIHLFINISFVYFVNVL